MSLASNFVCHIAVIFTCIFFTLNGFSYGFESEINSSTHSNFDNSSYNYHHRHYQPVHERLDRNKIPMIWPIKNDTEIAKEKWDCWRFWPDLTLFIPFQAYNNDRGGKFYDIELFAMKTYFEFWPIHLSDTNVILAYDAEHKDYSSIRSIKATMMSDHTNLVNQGKISFLELEEFPYYRNGYNKQQYMMFWASNYTNSSFIGFGDSDMAFITYVDREDLFDGDKPIINGRSGAMGNDIKHWALGSKSFLGIDQPMTCMSYFPFIIKREHLISLRNYIEELHGSSFDEVFYNVTDGTPYSQFGVMCTYLWEFHQDDYRWYVHTETPNWDGKNPPPARGQNNDMSIFSPEMYRPFPRIATHARHRYCRHGQCPTVGFDNVVKKAADYQYFIEQGQCRSPPFPNPDSEDGGKCAFQNKFYFEMHNFDYTDYTKHYDKEALNYEAKLRYHRIKNCPGVRAVRDNV